MHQRYTLMGSQNIPLVAKHHDQRSLLHSMVEESYRNVLNISLGTYSVYCFGLLAVKISGKSTAGPKTTFP